MNIIDWLAITFFGVAFLVIFLPIAIFFIAAILAPSSSFPDLE